VNVPSPELAYLQDNADNPTCLHSELRPTYALACLPDHRDI